MEGVVIVPFGFVVHHPCFMKPCSHVCSVGVHGHAQCSCPMDMILLAEDRMLECPN